MQGIVKTVLNLKAKGKGIIARFDDDKIAGKMLSMGMLPGSNVEVVRIAPLGGGYYLKINGHCIAVRKNEAAHILLN